MHKNKTKENEIGEENNIFKNVSDNNWGRNISRESKRIFGLIKPSKEVSSKNYMIYNFSVTKPISPQFHKRKYQ